MAIETFSKFYYGFEITTLNNNFNFDEGGGELTATFTLGIYSPDDLALEIKTALDAAGTKVYTVTFNRITRKFTIACDSGTFDILIDTGTNTDTGVYELIGFVSAVDLTGLGTYTSNEVAGSEYKVQFKLQEYTPSAHWLEKTDAAVNEAADGTIEVVSFGDINYLEFNLLFITDKPMDGRVVRNNPNGVSDVIDFLTFCIKRGPIDFMPDENDPDTYEKIVLDTTEASGKGVSFRLKEETGKSLPGFYQTGKLKWRVVI